MAPDSRGFFETLIGNGSPLLTMTGLCLALAGAFAIFQSTTGHFMPHDVAFLEMSPQELCSVNECRIVHFMIHDRVSFGGSLIAIGVLYLWLAEFPLRQNQTWAWWTFLGSGVVGFSSFLAYLGYGYLDTWHGVATLALLPCFVGGLWRSRKIGMITNGNRVMSWRSCLLPSTWPSWQTRQGLGCICLLAAAIGSIGAGFTIQIVGMTTVFVPSDLTFMGVLRTDLDMINPRLVPLIAHDRAGFGGAVATAGLLVFASIWWGDLSRSLWQALVLAGVVAWSTAIGVHPAIGYNNAIHLAPAVLGAILYFAGLILTQPAHSRPASDA